MVNKKTKAIFPKIKNMGKRNWGKEDLLVLIPKKLTLKLLELKKGKKGGLQYHRKKNECGFVISGKLLVRYDSGNNKLKEKILKKGDVFHFPPGSVHQEEAITDCKIIEASTPFFNDRVRVEEIYGIERDKKGLPTTKLKEIIRK